MANPSRTLPWLKVDRIRLRVFVKDFKSPTIGTLGPTPSTTAVKEIAVTSSISKVTSYFVRSFLLTFFTLKLFTAVPVRAKSDWVLEKLNLAWPTKSKEASEEPVLLQQINIKDYQKRRIWQTNHWKITREVQMDLPNFLPMHLTKYQYLWFSHELPERERSSFPSIEEDKSNTRRLRFLLKITVAFVSNVSW